jgi:hypothetical protein
MTIILLFLLILFALGGIHFLNKRVTLLTTLTFDEIKRIDHRLDEIEARAREGVGLARLAHKRINGDETT